MSFIRHLEQADFRNSFVEELRGEIAPDTRSRQVPGCMYSQVAPTPVRAPHLLAWSDDFAAFLGLEAPEERGAAVEILGGNRVVPTMKPFAARYGGHQFGNWAGQLGDGRAISLGEVQATDGSWWEIQLKGAGPTPYSRRADGRAVLRSSLREFLCSEAMHALGVPTTRALSLVATGDGVMRDMFYDGNVQEEPGAIVARVAPSFVRFGNFQIFAAHGETENLRACVDYVLRHHFAELGAPSDDTYLRWFDEVCRRTAVMIAHWMSVGFVHGVMNTDNMSVLGLTIDYGPCGWLEPYDPNWTPNTTDFSHHRYAFGKQPGVALWNLVQMAQALVSLVPDVEGLRTGLETYRRTFAQTQHEMMLRKLGLTAQNTEADAALFEELHAALSDAMLDMTIFYRRLSHMAGKLLLQAECDGAIFQDLVKSASYPDTKSDDLAAMLRWLPRWAARLREENNSGETVRAAMLQANPKYVLRNYLAQQAIEAASEGDRAPLQRLMQVLQTPFEEQSEHDELAAKRPEWARHRPGCATLSCSS